MPETSPSCRIRLFAALRDRAGTTELWHPLRPGTTAGTLKAELAKAYPELAPLLVGVRMAVALEYVTDDTPIQPHDDIAIIPPVSGG